MADQSLAAFRDEARRFLETNLPVRRSAVDQNGARWGEGNDEVAVFHNFTPAEEHLLLQPAVKWQQRKLEAGYGALCYPERFGGAGLSRLHERAFQHEEALFESPATTETFRVTLGLIAPTLLRFGSEALVASVLPHLLRVDFLVCQLFSEPSAGSDLAGLSCKAQRFGDRWIINGQKVWTSGATVSKYGLLIARTSSTGRKHAGLTAFLLPLDRPGVDIHPIRQMTGGSAFSAVYFNDVELDDAFRVGDEGEGWAVALTTLAFEREVSGELQGTVGGTIERLLALARHIGANSDPVVRDRLADLYSRYRVLELHNRRVAAASQLGEEPIAASSIGKLMWTENMRRMSDVASLVLGPRAVADSGEWGIYCWSEHILGAPGYRIAGGSDEIQRNIISERCLGLPREPSTKLS